ncbi:MAG: Smr/MutS family protein [Bacteroidetes bacterium]|nr:Smr/MutS family protein [Bacteroidota bacterium]
MKDEISQYPTDGILDLHTFHPRDAADVTREYLRACHSEGIYHIRIIHGKGTGTLRATVHAVLAKSPLVDSWRTATDSSSWGATLVELKPRIGPGCA